jgi:hypothetical protein
MKNLIQDTLNKIKKEHIAPEPRWKFLARKFGAWIVLLLIVLLGALSVSVAYYLLAQLDWEVPTSMHQSRLVYGFSVFPYFWLVLLGIFGMGAFWSLRKTENGYRFSGLKITLVVVGGILFSGIFLSAIGVNKQLNRSMMQNVPYYAMHTTTKETQWMQPEKGFLAGTIQSINGKNITLNDLNGQKWEVEMAEKIVVRPSANVSVGQMIKIVGAKKAGQNFEALEIRPWIGRGMMGGGNQDGVCPLEGSGGCANRGGMMNGNGN